MYGRIYKGGGGKGSLTNDQRLSFYQGSMERTLQGFCSVMQCYDNMTVHLTGYQIDGGRSRIRVYCYTNPYFGVSCAAMGWKSMEMMIHHFLGRRGPNNP